MNKSNEFIIRAWTKRKKVKLDTELNKTNMYLTIVELISEKTV